MQVYLNENVFIGLILSAVEVYKKECFGLLLGYRNPDKFIVEHAIPYQSVKRGHSWTELRPDKWTLITEVLKNFPKLDVIGDFHSHTMYRDVRADVTLSTEDIKYMDEADLQIVIAVNENKRARSKLFQFDHTVSGALDKYQFKIAAYYFEQGRRNGNARPKLAEISGPLSTRIGRT
ncbi:MAG: hypothetical protein HY282_02125 [Nitrospirae bacterium]|nr:hypothetical protein [Candidatus Manganitrophaceae bacterium]